MTIPIALKHRPVLFNASNAVNLVVHLLSDLQKLYSLFKEQLTTPVQLFL